MCCLGAAQFIINFVLCDILILMCCHKATQFVINDYFAALKVVLQLYILPLFLIIRKLLNGV